VNLYASVASERIRALLVGKKKNQVRLSLCGHEVRGRIKSAVVIGCNRSVAVALWATRTLPAGKRLQPWRGFLEFGLGGHVRALKAATCRRICFSARRRYFTLSLGHRPRI
jgi:hypothetical protein